MKMMNKDSRNHILKALKKDIRYDGRSLKQYRDLEIQRGVAKTAEGSARVKLGDTEVMAGIKMQVEEPFPDTPNEGKLMVGAELIPLSNSEYELGPPGIDSIELSRVVDRGIRESKCVDTSKLVIESGSKVWSIWCDIIPINSAGNLFDAAFLATLAALQDAHFPAYDTETGVVDYKNKTDTKLPMEHVPIAVTVLKIGDQMLVDPLPPEEEALDARLTVTVTGDNKLCAMQKGGISSVSAEDIDKMASLALEKSEELKQHLMG